MKSIHPFLLRHWTIPAPNLNSFIDIKSIHPFLLRAIGLSQHFILTQLLTWNQFTNVYYAIALSQHPILTHLSTWNQFTRFYYAIVLSQHLNLNSFIDIKSIHPFLLYQWTPNPSTSIQTHVSTWNQLFRYMKQKLYRWRRTRSSWCMSASSPLLLLRRVLRVPCLKCRYSEQRPRVGASEGTIASMKCDCSGTKNTSTHVQGHRLTCSIIFGETMRHSGNRYS